MSKGNLKLLYSRICVYVLYSMNLVPYLLKKKKTGTGFCRDLNLLEKLLVFEYLFLALLKGKLEIL